MTVSDDASAPLVPVAPDEAPTRQLTGALGSLASALAIGLSLYSLYWVLFVVQPQIYRVSFLLVALVLTFLLVPAAKPGGNRVSTVDWLLIAATIVALSW